MALIIKGGRQLFPNKKQNHLPIIKDILQIITEEELLLISDIKVNTIFKVTWTDFMKMWELTYTMAEMRNTMFIETDLTRFNISFVENDQYAILCLKQSKTIIDQTEM